MGRAHCVGRAYGHENGLEAHDTGVLSFIPIFLLDMNDDEQPGSSFDTWTNPHTKACPGKETKSRQCDNLYTLISNCTNAKLDLPAHSKDNGTDDEQLALSLSIHLPYAHMSKVVRSPLVPALSLVFPSHAPCIDTKLERDAVD